MSAPRGALTVQTGAEKFTTIRRFCGKLWVRNARKPASLADL
ncbi:hypothetical protein [Salinivibrio kushneri]|nr:hypothetical protein [Salinivibrio kushneri]